MRTTLVHARCNACVLQAVADRNSTKFNTAPSPSPPPSSWRMTRGGRRRKGVPAVDAPARRLPWGPMGGQVQQGRRRRRLRGVAGGPCGAGDSSLCCCGGRARLAAHVRGRAWSPGWFCADWWRDSGFVLPMQLFRSSWLKPAVFICASLASDSLSFCPLCPSVSPLLPLQRSPACRMAAVLFQGDLASLL